MVATPPSTLVATPPSTLVATPPSTLVAMLVAVAVFFVTAVGAAVGLPVAAVALAGFVAVSLFADFAVLRPTVRPSLAVRLGYEDVYFAGGVVALGLYPAGIVAWAETAVFEGLAVTGTKPAPLRE